MVKDLQTLALGLLFLAIGLLLLWLALVMAKPLVDFSDKCAERGGTVVHMKCLDVKEL